MKIRADGVFELKREQVVGLLIMTMGACNPTMRYEDAEKLAEKVVDELADPDSIGHRLVQEAADHE